jgi:hypothetical protein
VLILEANVKPDKLSNFDKCTSEACTLQGLPYDYGSVMHYSAYSFAIGSNPTITKLDGSTSFGQRNGFSDLDIQGINKFYCGELRLYENNKDYCLGIIPVNLSHCLSRGQI